MDSPLHAPWTNAARAGYFGDRACPFCDQHNPVGAKFCNGCGSPLDLKPCNQCDAVNYAAATTCYQCGAEYPALFTTPEATPGLPAADPTPVWATPGGMRVVATLMEPPFAGTLRANRRFAAIATMLIAGVYAAYRINAAPPDAIGVASQPIDAGKYNPPIATSALLMAVESKPVEPEATAALQTPIPTANPEAPKRASTRHRPAPVPATKHASVRQRQAPAGATPSVAQALAATPVGAPVAETYKAPRPDPWEAMHVSLASCGGDLIARILCDQRVRRIFCEGHWGEAPECGSVVASDHGR